MVDQTYYLLLVTILPLDLILGVRLHCPDECALTIFTIYCVRADDLYLSMMCVHYFVAMQDHIRIIKPVPVFHVFGACSDIAKPTGNRLHVHVHVSKVHVHVHVHVSEVPICGQCSQSP